MTLRYFKQLAGQDLLLVIYVSPVDRGVRLRLILGHGLLVPLDIRLGFEDFFNHSCFYVVVQLCQQLLLFAVCFKFVVLYHKSGLVHQMGIPVFVDLPLTHVAEVDRGSDTRGVQSDLFVTCVEKLTHALALVILVLAKVDRDELASLPTVSVSLIEVVYLFPFLEVYSNLDLLELV